MRTGTTGAVTLLALLGTGFAPGSAALAVQRSARVGIAVTIDETSIALDKTYDVTVSGFSRRRATAHLFIDYQGCAKSFSAERSRAGSEAEVYAVRGDFGVTSGWKSSQTGTDHACAYLLSSAGSVIATAKRSYLVG